LITGLFLRVLLEPLLSSHWTIGGRTRWCACVGQIGFELKTEKKKKIPPKRTNKLRKILLIGRDIEQPEGPLAPVGSSTEGAARP
jgi:hypothetical protein